MSLTHEANMEEVWVLLLLSLAMLIGCYIAGSIPLAMPMSEEKLKLVSVLGAGLLVGTALTVIIPEGVNTLYETAEQVRKHSHSHEEKANVAEKTEALSSHKEPHEHSHVEMHSLIGVALVLGFVFMLLVDQLSGAGGHGHSHSATPDPEPASGGNNQNRKKITATLGLVVHAAADGVALGAAATTSQTHVEMIVFIAIMLHKAPAAFGLVSFLLHDGFERSRIRKHLAVFSAAAPVLAVITYFGLSQQDKETLSEINATGLAMLFSAGTFLYVSTVHILPEILKMGPSKSAGANGNVIVREQHGFTKVELLTLVIGSLLPLVLSLGHHH